MKYLLVFVVVFLIAWRWRSARTAQQLHKAHQKAAAQSAPVDMVSCRQCGLHVPAQDAITGVQGLYCSATHLKAAER